MQCNVCNFKVFNFSYSTNIKTINTKLGKEKEKEERKFGTEEFMQFIVSQNTPGKC